MARPGKELEFNSGQHYRDDLLARSSAAVRNAQYYIDAYKALSICLLSHTQNDLYLPDFLEETIIDNFYEGPPNTILDFTDFAVEMAEEFMGCEMLSGDAYKEHAFIKKNDFASLDPEQLWIYYVPNTMFLYMELDADGRIPEELDTNKPYIFSTYNKQFPNNVLETQIEMAEFATEFLSPLVEAMMQYLDNELGLHGNVKPHYFANLIKLAKKHGHDVSKPLVTNREFSWFDMYWDAILIEEDKLQALANDNTIDIEIPPGTVLQ